MMEAIIIHRFEKTGVVGLTFDDLPSPATRDEIKKITRDLDEMCGGSLDSGEFLSALGDALEKKGFRVTPVHVLVDIDLDD